MTSTATPLPPVNPPKSVLSGLKTKREHKDKTVMKWRERPKKMRQGWYAVHYSWDSQEGSFLDYAKLDNGEWASFLPIMEVAGPFSSKQKAVEWAEKHDPTW